MVVIDKMATPAATIAARVASWHLELVRMSLSIGDARVVVGLDFGTTFSGFAYAHRSAPDKVFKLYEWPDATRGGGRPYCKTPTSLYYVQTGAAGEYATSNEYQLKDWGWPALVSYTQDTQRAARAHRQQELRRKNSEAAGRQLSVDDRATVAPGRLVTKFKLFLAGKENVCRSVVGPLPADSLPTGLTAETCIKDYLCKISAFIIKHLQTKFGTQLTNKQVQWCLTVPTIWDNIAKQNMRACAERAGLVAGPLTPLNVVASPHPLLIVLEPEAASAYCLEKCLHLDLTLNDQFLVVDIGGGTVDIVLHAKVSDGRRMRVREVRASNGGLCGGAFVDQNFFRFLCNEIGCLEEFLKENVSMLLSLQAKWQSIKSTFDGARDVLHDLDVPAKLAREWERYDEQNGADPRAQGYEEIPLSTSDIKSIFDPVVDEIIRLIDESMTPDVRALMVVGGFSASPYLRLKIQERFSTRVQEIINPPEPGSAICHGAVLMGIAPSSGIIARILRKTYGVPVTRTFNHMIDPIHKLSVQNERNRCIDLFRPFVYKGWEVATDHCVTEVFYPSTEGQEEIEIEVYSSSEDTTPQFVTDEGVVCEGRFTMDISEGMELEMERAIRVSMFLGKSAIEVRAQRENFGDTTIVETLQVKFEHD